MSYFSYVGKLFTNVKSFYSEINAATLTGAIDTVIVKQEDGSYLSSPFHIRFGKLGVLRTKEKVIDIEINGESVDLQMKLGDSGEAFFIEHLEEESEDVPSYLATSPLPSAENLMEQGIQEMKQTYVNAAGNVVEYFAPTVGNGANQISEKFISEEGPEIAAHGDSTPSDGDGSKKRIRKKKKTLRRSLSGEGAKKKSENTEDDIFDMDDVSSDEELRNFPPMRPSLGKSVSLPVMEETKLQRTSEWASAQYNAYHHPFSDTDMSPVGSPASTRPPSPKSDTEVDRQRNLEVDQSILSEEDTTLWEWGDLPRSSLADTPSTTVEVKEKPSANVDVQPKGGLFRFMKKTKNVRHKPEGEGIYLDDLNLDEMDPEVAKLYFPKKFHQQTFRSIKEKVEAEEDTESGRGASLPVSPHSVEGAICGPPVSFLSSEVKHLGNFSLSLCGGLTDPAGINLDKFMKDIVTFDDLCENFSLTSNPDLVVRIADKYYNWQTAAPIILAHVVFDKEFPEETLNNLTKEYMPKPKEKKGGGVSSWFSWRRSTTEGTNKIDTSPASGIGALSDSDIAAVKSGETSASTSPPASSPPSVNGSPRKRSARKITDESLKSEGTEASCEDLDSDSDHSSRKGHKISKSEPIELPKSGKEKFKKTLRLTSEQIVKLNLHEGQNEITFSITTQYQGTTRCTSHIYLWRYDDKIIVSDIDGTITKSDVLGQILPIIGKDWSQSGVAQLFTQIHNNGYKYLYLSARAIGQSKVTKDLLKSIKQEYFALPDGPLLLSPTSLVSAFHREVIEKKPEEFKIACLKDIGELFPGHQPFYAGFGNKINDVYAYKAISIPPTRIFTINHKGELKQESTYTFQSSYYSLSEIADHFFPPRERHPGHVPIEYSMAHYWRDPLPSVSETELISVINETDNKSTDQEKG